MKCIRKLLEDQEAQMLHPKAARSSESRGRARPEPSCDIRPAFQHDRDRILHSKSFRRLKHKTQVFLAPAGDHYRTRLTHTLEVSQIARTIGKALCLNESLIEAIALGHDLGHTPFGHAGESVLNKLNPDGFHHSVQSLRVVDLLEREGAGLNLTHEVREGILMHSKGKGKILSTGTTLEAQVVRLSDLIAYLSHDVDDASRAGVVRQDEIPKQITAILGKSHGDRIEAMVRDAISETLNGSHESVNLSAEVHEAAVRLRDFLYERVYDNPTVHNDFVKASKILEELYQRFVSEPEAFTKKGADLLRDEKIDALATDFISGMTDRYALALYEDAFMPQPWKVI